MRASNKLRDSSAMPQNDMKNTMIGIGLSPNAAWDDVILAASVLATPWRWFRGGFVRALEEWFKRYFAAKSAIAFDSGRSSEYAILKAINISPSDEVLVQAFTCVAVPNSVLWAGGKPIYVDVDKTGNIDVADLEKKITPKTKAIIVQHTFGIAASIEKIQTIAKEHRLILIEDCAHSLGATVAGKKLGSFGDFAFFSFGRDKVVSSVCGGMVILNNSRYAKNIRGFQKNLSFPSVGWIFSQLFHPIVFSFIVLPFYNVLGIGKIVLVIFQRLGLLSKPVAEKEKRGERPAFYPKKLPNAQAIVALNQVKKLSAFNTKRQEIAAFYTKALADSVFTLPTIKKTDIVLRYNIQTQHASALYRFAKDKGILLGRWYGHVIDPTGVEYTKIVYQAGSCPKAEFLARQSLNLPTYPKMSLGDAARVVAVLTEYGRNKDH